MAEDSAYWSGTILGDAVSTTLWSAPYNDSEYADIWSKLLASNDNQGFVVAKYANNLRVYESTPLGRTVNVATGALFLRGRIYENTAVTPLTFAVNSSGNPRIDRVIVRLTAASQTIRLAVLQGVAAASPSIPALTQTTALYEVSLAYVWIPDGATLLSNFDIHDEREFTCTSADLNDSYGNTNLVQNSEFMAFSELSGGATAAAPDYWELFLAPADIANYTKPSQMSRGRAIQITSGVAPSGISRGVPVKPNTMYSIKILIRVEAGDSAVITVDTLGGTFITRHIDRTGTWVVETIYLQTEAADTQLTIYLYGQFAGDIIQIGQVMVIEGYIPGPFRPFRETLMFTKEITDANWATTAKSTGTTTITLSADFQALVLAETRNILISITARDSGSAAGTPSFSARPFGATGTWVSILLGGITNDALRTVQGMLALDSSLRFTLAVTASGAGTLDALATIVGITI